MRTLMNLKDTNAYDYLFYASPLLQIGPDEYEDYTPELLMRGFTASSGTDLVLDVTAYDDEDQLRIQAFLYMHGLCWRLEHMVRGVEEEGDHLETLGRRDMWSRSRGQRVDEGHVRAA